MTIQREAMFSTGTEHWSTPDDLFDSLNSIYGFTVDACADTTNYKVKKYYNKKTNGLSQSWQDNVVWVNPPYGRDIVEWVNKAYNEVSDSCTVVMLLPSRTDTKWMQDYVFGGARSVCFLRGRLKFSGSKTSAPFPSVIVVFSKKPETSRESEYLNSIGKNLVINE